MTTDAIPTEHTVNLADALLIGQVDDRPHLLLIRRGRDPQRGLLALPGGYVNPGEPSRAAAARELHEETGILLDPTALHPVACYEWARPESPRIRYLTFAYAALLPTTPSLTAGDDANTAHWVDLDQLDLDQLAFNHAQIAIDGLRWAGLSTATPDPGDCTSVVRAAPTTTPTNSSWWCRCDGESTNPHRPHRAHCEGIARVAAGRSTPAPAREETAASDVLALLLRPGQRTASTDDTVPELVRLAQDVARVVAAERAQHRRAVDQARLRRRRDRARLRALRDDLRAALGLPEEDRTQLPGLVRRVAAQRIATAAVDRLLADVVKARDTARVRYSGDVPDCWPTRDQLATVLRVPAGSSVDPDAVAELFLPTLDDFLAERASRERWAAEAMRLDQELATLRDRLAAAAPALTTIWRQGVVPVVDAAYRTLAATGLVHLDVPEPAPPRCGRTLARTCPSGGTPQARCHRPAGHSPAPDCH